ncbi:1,6-anhydro-N-acetylmuramyl-L-alanine amidase AmpD [Sulfuricystis multivorans]|uniref:1,6-anhydro-N-acetylmuramyl-L-alanine amidase AmpD n=1 Tax=Sulfuricystis multivorans TaxID=2211108 RepID=UPI000F83DC2E|nr:1,6-anhydro-N-acetylmuramyl-L-alanine amidase AmpD [Sulfuricystis multivorans]
MNPLAEALGPLDAAGWLTGVQHIASPNCDDRPPDATIDLIVIHAISLPPGEFGGGAVIDLFTNRLDPARHPYFASLAGTRVSAHFFVRRDGTLIQFVPCRARAWHAGASCWRGRERCNDFSLGIEVEGDDFTPFADAQYATLGVLIERLRQSFPLVDIVGHADIAPGRKTDPGPYFDWLRISRQ